MAETRRQRVSWKRVGIALGSIFLGMWLLGAVIGYLQPWYIAHAEARNPKASLMPRSLPNKRVGDLAPRATVNALGYAMKVPWTKVAKSHESEAVSSFWSESGSSLSVIAMFKSSPMLPTTDGSDPGEVEQEQRVFGRKTLSSGYEYLKAEMDSSPRDVSLFQSPAKNARAMTLLMMKTAEVQDATAIYPISFGSMHGFQFGDPTAAPKSLHLRLFDNKDREIWLILRVSQKDGGLDQETVNAIVVSIQPPP